MTINNVLSFIKAARDAEADIKVNSTLLEFSNDAEFSEEDDMEMACDLLNWIERGDAVAYVKRNGQCVGINDFIPVSNT